MLHSTAQDYVKAIQPIAWTDATTAQIALVGRWPNTLEAGCGPFDLRTTLLVPGKVRAVRVSKEGFLYLAVPFRHGAGGKGGGKGGRVMGSAYRGMLGDKAAAQLGKALAARAKALEATLSSPAYASYGTMYGGRLPAGLAPKLQEHHGSDIYAGMVREQKTYRSATQNQYMTWRMITTNPASRKYSVSGRASWMHPGIKPANLLRDVQAFVERERPAVMGAGASTGGGK
jgi:hypothetical protein